jgi:hypothetical protein
VVVFGADETVRAVSWCAERSARGVVVGCDGWLGNRGGLRAFGTRVVVGVFVALVAWALCLAYAAWASAASWAVVLSPGVGALSAVSCTSARACTAVGAAFVGGRDRPLAERWNGTSWSIQPTPQPRGAKDSTLNGVSCTSTRFCIAVGLSTNRGGNRGRIALVERWNGTHWSIQRTPKPRGAAESFLNGVSCTSPTACTAVGGGIYSIGPFTFIGGGVLLAERWNGSRWSIQRIPVPRAASGLSGVACVSRSFCIAVGSTAGSTGQVPLAERWNGTAWTLQRIPAPGSLGDFLWGISCTSNTACTAVGDSAVDSSLDTHELAERWHVTATERGRDDLVVKWSLQATPSPGDAFRSLRGVSCASTRACTAVGTQTSSATTLAQRWNGLTWSIDRTPSSPGATSSGLAGVSCTSVNACIAVGFIISANNTLTLAERFS